MRCHVIDSSTLFRLALSSFPYIALITIVIGYTLTKCQYLISLFVVLIISHTLNRFILKPSIYKVFSTYEWVVKRPPGCRGYCTDVCGMPSDHAQGTALLCAMVTYLFFRRTHPDGNIKTRILLMWLYLIGLAVIYSRVYYQYHTGLQVIVGVLIGGIIGLGFMRLDRNPTGYTHFT